MVGTVVNVVLPFKVRLLKITAVPPAIVPEPAKTTVPAPCVKVLAFVSVPVPAMVSVPPLVITTEPLLDNEVVVMVPLAPKVNDLALLMVTDAGALATAAFIVTAWLIVTADAAGGKALPNQVVVVFQSVAALDI